MGKSKNLATRRRQKKRQKERRKVAKQRDRLVGSIRKSSSASDWEKYVCESCIKKIRYSTEDAAIAACVRSASRLGCSWRWYHCAECGGWHVTHRPKKGHSPIPQDWERERLDMTREQRNW